MVPFLQVNAAAQLPQKSEHRQLNQCRQTPESLPESNGAGTNTTSHPFTVTVQAEVHLTNEVPTNRGPSPQPKTREDISESSNDKDSDSDGGRYECTLNRNPEEVEADCLVVGNSVSREREGDQRMQGNGDHSDNGGKTSGSERGQNLKAEEPSHTNVGMVTPEDFFSPQYKKELEEAFIANHLYATRPQSIVESVRSTILQAQVRKPSSYVYTCVFVCVCVCVCVCVRVCVRVFVCVYYSYMYIVYVHDMYTCVCIVYTYCIVSTCMYQGHNSRCILKC